MIVRSQVVGLRRLPAAAGGDQCRVGLPPRDLGRVDHPAHQHPPAPYRSARRETSDLATAAAKAALAHAGIGADALDLIVGLATSTSDHTFPATATQVQARLGMDRGAAFDVQAVCSGFVYALAVADNFIHIGQVRTALVIGAETFSRILDWKDRGTCVLFGDGAGAVVLQRGRATAMPPTGAS